MKKNGIIVVISIGVLVLLIFAFSFPRDYEVTYEKDGYEIKETYHNTGSYYEFSVEVGDVSYDMVVKSKRFSAKRLIKNVDVFEGESASCLLMKSEKFEGYPICYDGEEYLDYSLVEDASEEFYKRNDIKKIDDVYNGIDLKSELGKSYFIWNYKGYYVINDKTTEEIKFLDRESYYNNLAYSTGEFLITPNYDQDYVFTEFFVIDMKSGKVSTWKLNEEISFNSYYLGEKDGIIYMVDRKNKAEYSINPKKKKLERVDKDGMGKVWNAKWDEVSMTKLTTDDYVFETNSIFDFHLENSSLYLTLPEKKESIRLTDKTVDKVVYKTLDEVFYLVKDELYNYSLQYGENLILKYSEFNFNSLNSIFIY